MKRVLKNSLVAVLGLLMFVLTAATVKAATEGDFEYTTLSDQTAQVTGYIGSDSAITIPGTLGGLPVSSIGNSAFANRAGLTSVVIPEGIKTIGDDAFKGCTGLSNIALPSTLTGIGYSPFQGSGITQITVDVNNPSYSSENGVLFNKDKTVLVTYPGGISGAYTIPNSVTQIRNNAFAYCTGLTSLNLGAGVASIGESAFKGCTGLASITFGQSVSSIGNNAFYGCTGLAEIIVDSNNSTYASEDGVLYNKSKTAILIFPSAKSGFYVIPDTVTSIGESAFKGYTGLTSVTIGTGVTSIGDYAFYGCTGLTSITIPNGVLTIGQYAFHGTKITSLSIPNSVTSIGNWAFANCTQLASLTLGSGLTSIGAAAFRGCTALASVVIPNSVTSIGESAFKKCTNLTSVTLGTGITNISSAAFYECPFLTSVTIPGNVTNIEVAAFQNCRTLAAANFSGNAPTMGAGVFQGAAGNFKVYYFSDKTGFTNPWYTYTTVSVPAPASAAPEVVYTAPVAATAVSSSADATTSNPQAVSGLSVVASSTSATLTASSTSAILTASSTDLQVSVLKVSSATTTPVAAEIIAPSAPGAANGSTSSGSGIRTAANTAITVAPEVKAVLVRNLTVGTTGSDVKELQKFLNATGFAVASTGSGASGNETTYFGSLTRRALIKFQAANNLPATGYFGPMTKKVINSN